VVGPTTALSVLLWEGDLKTILEILTDIRPESDFLGSDDFIKEGLLDSLDVVTLVNDLEHHYGISIGGLDILPEHFRSVVAIRALLTKYGSQQ
jgi:acyl carrier protein